MTFQGDGAQVPVANIVQALFINGQEGVLTIDSGTMRRRFRILKLGLRPLLTTPKDLSLLEHAVVKERILTQKQFQNAVSTWNGSSPYPGEFLVKRRVLSPEQVEEGIRKQLEESILEILTARDLRYEFSAGERCTDHEIFDPEGLGSTLIYSVNGILMEAVRREDEWRRIEAEVPTGYEIYTAVTGSLPATMPSDLDLSSAHYEETRGLLTGDRSVERIIAESALSRYEVYNVLYQLKTRGHVRCLKLSEKEALADKLRRLVKHREAVDVYRSILEDDPQNVRTRIQLIFLLEKSEGHPEVLVEHYLELVDQFRDDEPEKAESYIEKALGLDPDHLPALERLFTLHAVHQNRPAAMAAVRAILKSVKKTERYREGGEILLRVVNYFPQEPTIYHDLADLLIASSQNDLAVATLKTVADIYRRAADYQRLVKTYELIVRIDPSELAELRKLEAERKKSQITHTDLMRLAAITALSTTLLTIGSYYLLVEFQSRTAFAEVETMVQQQLGHSRFQRARATVGDFQNAYWYSSRQDEASTLLQVIAKKERDAASEAQRRDTEATAILSRALNQAETLNGQGEVVEAAEALRVAVASVAHYPLQGAQKLQLQRATERRAELVAYVDQAAALSQEVTEALQTQSYERAHERALRLVDDYPHAPATREARIPIVLETTPPGAEVSVNGKALERSTPLLLHVAALGRIRVQLKLPGFRPVETALNAREAWRFTWSLEKDAIWSFDSNGPIDGFPVVVDDVIFFGNRDGKIFALNEGGKKRWREIDVRLDTSRGLGFWNNILYFGNFDGTVYLVNASTGTLRGSVIRASAARLPIKHAPAAASPRGVATFNCGDKLVVGVDLTAASDQPKWTFTSPAALLGSPQLGDSVIHCFTTAGTLLLLDPDTALRRGKLLGTVSFGQPLTHPGIVAGSMAWVAFPSGDVRCVDPKTGTTVWSQTLSAAPAASPTASPEESAVLVPLTSGELACLDSATGEIRWQRDPSGLVERPTSDGTPIDVGSIETQGAISGGRFYVGTRKGWILAWNLADGTLHWLLRTAGADETPPKGIYCPGVVQGGLLYQGSDDGRLYCVDVDTK